MRAWHKYHVDCKFYTLLRVYIVLYRFCIDRTPTSANAATNVRQSIYTPAAVG